MSTARWLCLGVAVLSAACGGDHLKKLKMPREGVRLAYDLQPGATYEGHLQAGTTREIPGLKEHLNQNVECDAKLLVLGAEQEGTVVTARFSAIDLDWGVLPDAGLSRDEFVKLAGEQLRGLELRFVVSPRGKVLQWPEPADTLQEPMHELFDVLSASVGSAFVELPAKGLRPGDRWSVAGDAQRIDATFEGLFDGEGEHDLARLELVFDASRFVQTESGQRQAQTEGTTRGLFSTAGFFASLDVEARDFDPRVGMGLRRIAAQWRKTGAGRGDATNIQTITDPCDPDYVGELECPEPEAPAPQPEPEPAPAPDAAPEPEPEPEAAEEEDDAPQE